MGEEWPSPAPASAWVPAEDPLDEEAEDQFGEDPDAPIEGRTTDQDFPLFFDVKTFGSGEAGEAALGGGGLPGRALRLAPHVRLALQTVGCGLCSRRSL